MHWHRLGCAGLVLLVGCGSGSAPDPAATISPETFSEVYVALRKAAREAESVEGFEAEKKEILERHGVTAEALIHFARVHGGNIETMAELWNAMRDRIEHRDSADARTAETSITSDSSTTSDPGAGSDPLAPADSVASPAPAPPGRRGPRAPGGPR